MKTNLKHFLLGIFLSLFLTLQSQIPLGYYNSTQGLTGFPLKTALYNIIKGHTVHSYNQLWTDFQSTDKKPNGKVWDIYSDIPGGTPPYEFTFGTNQCGNYSGEGDCYNREHTTPASWFSDASPMYSDLFNLYPTDGWVNNKRSNFPFGKVGSASWTSLNGSKLGTCSYPGFSGTVFEPIDSVKGDLARTLLYMATRYENIIASWTSNSTEAASFYAGNSTTVYKTWAVNMLLDWVILDPVSQKEIDRNNAVYLIQHNRNPYIDHPEWIFLIWGGNPVNVTSISVSSQTGEYSITTMLGTLQMIADVLPTNATNTNVSWSVINGSGQASISSLGLLTAETNGSVIVKATALDGSGVFDEKTVTISGQTVGISKSNQNNEFSVSYSFSDEFLKIISNSQSDDLQIDIYEICGKRIFSEDFSISENIIIDMHPFTKGAFIVNLYNKTSKSVFKFMR